jgi:DNA-directed RNA polymerase specialized sigma24 family protein
VRNLWLYHQRKAGRVISAQEDQFLYLAESAGMAFWQLGEEKAEQAEQIEQVKSAFSGLSSECHQFLLLNYFEYKDDAEIANMMNYALEFVKVKRFRCLKKLKEILGL